MYFPKNRQNKDCGLTFSWNRTQSKEIIVIIGWIPWQTPIVIESRKFYFRRSSPARLLAWSKRTVLSSPWNGIYQTKTEQNKYRVWSYQKERIIRVSEERIPNTGHLVAQGHVFSYSGGYTTNPQIISTFLSHCFIGMCLRLLSPALILRSLHKRL